MSHGRGLVASGVALIAVTYGLARFGYGLFLPEIRSQVRLSDALAGLIAGGSYAGYCLAIVVSGTLTERLGPRPTATLAGIVAATGMAAVAAAPGPAWLAGGVLVAGMSAGLASPPLAAGITMRLRSADQPRANTVVNSGTSLGVALSGPIALLAGTSWRGAYLLFTLLAAGVSAWAWRTLPPGRTAHDLARRQPPGAPRRQVLALILAGFLMGAASAVVWTFGGHQIVSVGAHPQRVATTAWVLIGLAGFVGAAAGPLARRIGLGYLHVSAATVLALAIAALATWPERIVAADAACALFGAAYITLTSVYLLWGLRLFPTQPSRGVVLPFLAIALGQFAGAPAAGILLATLGPTHAFLAFALLAITPLSFRPQRVEGGPPSPTSPPVPPPSPPPTGHPGTPGTGDP